MFTLNNGVGGAKLMRVPVNAALHRVIRRVNNNVPNNGGFGTTRANNPSNKYVPTSLVSAPVSCSGLATVNYVVNSKKLVMVSRSSYVISVTGFFLGFAMSRSYNGYAPYHINAGQLLRVLRGVASNGTALQSLSGLRRLYRCVGAGSLYKLNRATPGPILTALGFFHSRCITRIISGGYPTNMYGTLLSCRVLRSEYHNYATYTEGYPMNTVDKGMGRPRIVGGSLYIGYKIYVRAYGFNTVIGEWKIYRVRGIGVGVGNVPLDIPGKVSVLRTTECTKVRVPALYFLGSVGRVNTYHVYVMRIGNTEGLITTYIFPITRNVRVFAGARGIEHSEGAALRLVLSARSGGYLAYIHDKGYRLRGLYGRFNISGTSRCGNRAVRCSFSSSTTRVVESGGGYVLYHEYITTYSTRKVDIVNTGTENFSARVDSTFSESLTAISYVSYNRYVMGYPANTVIRGSSANGMLRTVGSPSGFMVIGATPSVETALNRTFNVGVNAGIRNGVITTLHELKFSGIFSASFTTSLAVVRRTGRLISEIRGNKILPVVASYSPN